MIITKKHLSRRTFLQRYFRRRDGAAPARCHGAGAHGAGADGGEHAVPVRRRSTCRAACIPTPGIPTQAGSDFEFKPVMQPLEPFRDQLVTISKMKAPWGESVHLGASSAFLNGVGPGRRRATGTGDAFGKIQSKKTLDQYIADKVAGDTPLRSIEVGTEDMGTAAGACDGFPCTFFDTLAWRDDTQPAAGRHQPARDLRADVRRDRLDRAAHGAAEGEAEPARLGDAGNGEAAQLARRARPRDPRRVSEQHPPGRAAARSHGDAGSARSPAIPRRRSACPRRSTIT